MRLRLPTLLRNRTEEGAASPWRLVLFASVVALVLRLWIPFAALMSPEGAETLAMAQPDCVGYIEFAHYILSGEESSTEPNPLLNPLFSRTPVYPGFIALVFWLSDSSFVALILAQMFFSSASSGLVCLLAFLLTGRRGVATVAGLIYAIDITGMAYVPLVMTETLFTFLLLCGLCLLANYLSTGRGVLLWTAGSTLGLAALCRPLALYLPAAVLIALSLDSGYRNRMLKIGCALLVPFALLVTPWMVRNKVRFEVFTMSSIPTVNLLEYQAAPVLARETGESPQLVRHRLSDSAGAMAMSEGGSAIVWMKVYKRTALTVIRERPAAYMRHVMSGVWRIAFGHLTERMARHFGVDWESPGLLSRDLPASEAARALVAEIDFWKLLYLWQIAFNSFSVAAAPLGLILLWRDRKRVESAVLGLVAGYVLAVSATNGYLAFARFRVPIAPLAAVLIAVAAIAVLQRPFGRRNT